MDDILIRQLTRQVQVGYSTISERKIKATFSYSFVCYNFLVISIQESERYERIYPKRNLFL